MEGYVLNPRTNRQIRIGGPTYRKLVRQGVNLANAPASAAPNVPSYARNPKTNRLIKANSPTYKKLVREGYQLPTFHTDAYMEMTVEELRWAILEYPNVGGAVRLCHLSKQALEVQLRTLDRNNGVTRYSEREKNHRCRGCKETIPNKTVFCYRCQQKVREHSGCPICLEEDTFLHKESIKRICPRCFQYVACIECLRQFRKPSCPICRADIRVLFSNPDIRIMNRKRRRDDGRQIQEDRNVALRLQEEWRRQAVGELRLPRQEEERRLEELLQRANQVLEQHLNV